MGIPLKNSAETVAKAANDNTRDLLEQFFTAEVPNQAVNDNFADQVVPLARRQEINNGARVEGTWLQRHIGDWFLTRTQTRSDLHLHKEGIANDHQKMVGQAQHLQATWQNEKKLKVHNDRFEKFNHDNDNLAQHVVEAEIEKRKLVQGTAESDRPEKPLSQEEAAKKRRLQQVREAAQKKWKRFAYQKKQGGRWRVKGLFGSALSWQNIKEKWQGRAGFWGFFKSLGADIAQWRAVKVVIPSVNLVRYGVETAQNLAKKHGEKIKKVGQAAKLVGQGKKAHKEVQREGAEAVIFSSGYLKDQLAKVTRGEVSREAFIAQYRRQIQQLKEQNPAEFAAAIKKLGVSARSLNTKSGLYEAMRRTAHWYLNPSERINDSLGQDLLEAAPIYGTYVAYQDLSDESGLPMSARYGFLAFSAGLDVLTIASFGAATPLLMGARAAVGGLVKGGGRVLGKEMAGRTLKAGVKTTAKQKLNQFLASIPKKSRQALKVPTAGRFLTGAAAYTGLSYGLDWVFSEGLRRYAEKEIIDQAEAQLETEFSRQQRRMLRLMGREVVPMARQAYTEKLANDNEPNQGLSEGAKAEVSKPAEEAKAA